MAKTGSSVTEHKIEEFAEDLGRLLGTARAKADRWLGQRQAIVKQLTGLRDEATTLLNQLGHEAAASGRRGRRAASALVAGIQKRSPGRPKGSGKKKRTMSAKARKAISEAQKARWAKQKASEKKK
jgi:hypothetical protein